MSTAGKIAARLRQEPTDRLPRLLRLYGPDALASNLILKEILRRRHLAGESYTLPTYTR